MWLTRVVVAYGAVSAFALLSYGLSGPTIAAVLATGAVISARAIARRNAHTVSKGLSVSFSQIGRGRFADAEAVLDVVDRLVLVTWARRLSDIQRATIAVRRGDLEAAVPLLDRAVERPVGRIWRTFDRHQAVSARSFRAFVLASLGARDAAERDIAEVRRSPDADADALARVSLAEALVLEKQGDRERLRELIHRDAELLFEHTHPRERAVVRALWRMLHATTTTVYRQKAAGSEVREGSEEPALADWIERVVPGAGRYAGAPGRRFSAAQSLERDTYVRPTVYGIRAVAAARAAGEQGAHERSANFIAIAVGLAITAVAANMVSVMSHGDFSGAEGPARVATAFTGYAIALAMSVGLLVVAGRRLRKALLGRRHERRLAPARALIRARGEADRDAAEREMQALTTSPSPLVAAQAHLSLAVLAERGARFDSVIAHCDAAIARLSSSRARAASGLLLPDVISLRALALAATDRFEEAHSELSGIYATYPHRELAVYRVRLVELVRTKRLSDASLWAEEHALDLPLTLREELLTDLVRAACHPEAVGAAEIARLRAELLRSDGLRRWIETVAPDVLDSFRSGGLEEGSPEAGMRSGAEPGRDLDDPDGAAETEALAELEAQHAHARLRVAG
jgi:hypothetical protein